MRDSFKHLTLAILTVVLVVVIGQNPGMNGQWGQASSFQEFPQLELSLPEQSDEIRASSQSEILRFALDSNTSYTLRYLTLAIEGQGLKWPETPKEWKVYEVTEEGIDYQKEMGYGEVFEEGFLRLRFFSDAARGYYGEAGEKEFVVVAPLYIESTPANLKLSFPSTLPEDFDWEFLYGIETRSWMELDPELLMDATQVNGIPSEIWIKN